MSRPLLIVGDVQGDAERLAGALEPYPERDVDTIFLGDFFQGGPPGEGGGAASARIARARQRSRAVLGNHDLMLLAVLEEVRTGWTPPMVLNFGKSSLADIWLWRRGDWADLNAVADDPSLEDWLRSLPLMLRLPDGTLIQHCDDDAYARLGDDVDAVNAAAREMLARPRGAWDVFWHTVGRRSFADAARLQRHLDRYHAARVVFGHTPHHQDRPVATHGGRAWSFDGCFSRYWTRKDDESYGPVEATVNLLPSVDTTLDR